MTRTQRNILVEQAVRQTVERIDYFISGGQINLPSPEYRRACESLLDKQSATVKTAAMFLMFYWLQNSDWDLDSVPVGIRGKYGDKLLSEELTIRSITLHNAITAFGENLGWKGNVRNVRLLPDPRFRDFLTQVASADPDMRVRIADFFAQRFAESKRESLPLPPVGADVLTFVRAKMLFYNLLNIPSEGHIQQFLVAALLHEYRRRQSIEVFTHHPHAADRYDNTAGDIEEKREGNLIRAYEVTVREDWKNRISNFKQKMDRFSLRKYVIIASGINDDQQWSVPANMALFIESYERDIAVVDIYDVVNYLAAELSATELRSAVNKAYEYLCDRSLSGRDEFKVAYRDAVRNWLDNAS